MQEKQYLEQSRKLIELRGYTKKTERFYLSAAQKFWDWCYQLDYYPDEIPYEEVQDFVLYLRNTLGYAPKTVNSYISVIRFLFTYVLHRPIDRYILPSMKVDHVERQVLSKEEVERFLRTLPNLKHKAMVALLYGCGLRSSEVVSLRYKDISRTGKTVYISEAKNRHSRYAPLPDFVLEILTEYWYAYGRPREWLFPGAKEGSHISRATLGKVVKDKAESLGWQEKKVTTHTFRHCLGTHMYEEGCDLFYIQKVLGHRSISSTLVYISAKPDARNPFVPMEGKTFV